MAGIKDQQNIDELRKRLYDRDFAGETSSRHTLPKVDIDVSRGWATSTPRVVPQTPLIKEVPTIPEQPVVAAPVEPLEIPAPPQPKKKRSYRLIILLASVLIFVLVATVSSVYLFFGANQISARNISLNLEAPFSIAAGERPTLQVSVSNQNSVPIESATLIINYPPGTKSVDESARDLYEERIPIPVIAAGEAMNFPLNAILFGEENEEKEIKAAIEYRVSGSNSTFFKEADPVLVRINSSPLVIRVQAVEKVSSGQELEVRLTVQSNASVAQRNILISAAYPNSFTFVRSDPEPSYGQNEWLISEIAPEASQTIVLRGRIRGVANEQAELQFRAGTPRSDNQYVMSSVLSQARTSYTIERPFIDVVVDINKDEDGSAVVEAGKAAEVTVLVTNTLDETIYDMRVEVQPTGNLIRDNLLQIDSGFYDSNTKTVRYEVSGMASLGQVLPGETREFFFAVRPDVNQQTAAFAVSTNVFARRVNEASAAEEIVGTAVAEAKYESEVKVRAQVGRNDGPFTDTGPLPPVANEPTAYTLTFEVETGTNDVTGGVFQTTFPQHVVWHDEYEGEGTIEFNPVAKQLRWTIGNMPAKSRKQLQVQVSLLPSVTQVGTSPVLVGPQQFRATDRFTETSIDAGSLFLTNELSTEAGYEEGNGTVQNP